ncbi:MAG TPA: SfnB family sulfur acquisition oxidoreductase [Roseiarcus sp.]|jgi:SfnB family sulfur acquisition oxidoreductase
MPSALATLDVDANEFCATHLRSPPARRIRDDSEALAFAEEVAAELAKRAVERDRDRILPYEEMELVSDAGLLAITVPKAYGGAGVRVETVARVIAALSRSDGSIGQIPQNHFFMLEGLRLGGSEEQKRFFYERVLAGERLGNALSETGTKTAHDHATLLTRDGSIYRLNGRKFYSTGVLFAHWVAVVANDEENVSRIAFVPRDTDGITIIDDWSGFGQRTTGSGTTVLKDVPVHPFSILSFSALFDRPTSMGPFAQILHAAVEQGIAEAALADTVQFVRTSARPYKDARVERASDDPYTVATAGELKIRVDASSALLARAGTFVDRAQAQPSVETVAAASVAVAESKIASTEAALLVASKLIELAGSSATLAKHGLDRHWRNARTHTVHDPVRWKYRAVGDYWLNGVNPPRHGAI